MCGIAGFVDQRRDAQEATLYALAERMAGAVEHRGPDSAGAWADPRFGLGLGHRRLAIIDLSAEGHQPMRSPSGRFVVVYNGEIYNHSVLRSELAAAGARFRGQSDTEVLVVALDKWGLEQTLRRLNGMFAFGLWDAVGEQLHLVRDRLGEKPLYYGWCGSTFLFGSELKALRAHPAFSAEVDRGALALYLRHSVLPAPHSIYRGIFKLPAGTVLTLGASSPPGPCPSPVPYWSLAEVAQQAASAKLRADDQDVVEQLEQLLGEAVVMRMQADVPVGAFLSGGIDSSLVVALMQRGAAGRVKTFTIGFSDSAYDESASARAVAARLGTEHNELILSPEDALDVIPQLPHLYDEPFADASQLPTFLVSRLTRSQVKVSLSGDGGDELFGGYNRYHWCRAIWDRIGWAPLPVRKRLASLLNTVPPQRWEVLVNGLGRTLPSRLRVRNPGTKIRKLADALPAADIEDMYFQLHSLWDHPADVVVGGHEAPSLLMARSRWAKLEDPVEQMMYLDAMTYMHDDILVKVDRASMAVSLEARVPFLDHRVVEFAWRIPLAMKIRNGQGKWVLRQILYRHLPRELVDRPKMGFGLPIENWLRGPLRPWAESLIHPERLRFEGFLRPEPVQRRWVEHLSGRRDWQYHLWPILMFQAWLESQRESLSTTSG